MNFHLNLSQDLKNQLEIVKIIILVATALLVHAVKNKMIAKIQLLKIKIIFPAIKIIQTVVVLTFKNL